jgi:septal ring factor EnvC (AmiA/AmiB activator)
MAKQRYEKRQNKAHETKTGYIDLNKIFGTALGYVAVSAVVGASGLIMSHINSNNEKYLQQLQQIPVLTKTINDANNRYKSLESENYRLAKDNKNISNELAEAKSKVQNYSLAKEENKENKLEKKAEEYKFDLSKIKVNPTDKQIKADLDGRDLLYIYNKALKPAYTKTIGSLIKKLYKKKST